MQFLDKILAYASLAGLVVFNAILVKFVAEPDLWVVISIVTLIAIYFILKELREGGSKFSHKTKEHES